VIPPQVIRGFFALAAAGIAKLGGEALGEHFDKKAHGELSAAERYVAANMKETARRRRGCLETAHSFAQTSKAAVEAPVGPLPETSAELPVELRAALDAIMGVLRSVSSTSTELISVREDPDMARKIGFAAYRAQHQGSLQAQANVAFTAAAYYALHGLKHAVNAKSFFEQAKVAAETARRSADRQLAAMVAAEETLGMMWNNTIAPLIHKAVGPPRSEKHAATVLTMVNQVMEQTEQMLGVTVDE
jgi:hypothetical protein